MTARGGAARASENRRGPGWRSHGVALTIDVAVKVTLVALLLLAVVRPDLPQFAGKAMTGRAIAYPVAAAIVPAAWWLGKRRHSSGPYPFAVDILVVLPFLIDVVGNALDLYDSITWWDDVNHLVNWAILTAAFGQLLLRLPLGRAVVAGLAGTRSATSRSG